MVFGEKYLQRSIELPKILPGSFVCERDGRRRTYATERGSKASEKERTERQRNLNDLRMEEDAV